MSAAVVTKLKQTIVLVFCDRLDYGNLI